MSNRDLFKKSIYGFYCHPREGDCCKIPITGFYFNCLPVLDTGSSKNINVLRSLDPGSRPGRQTDICIFATVSKAGMQPRPTVCVSLAAKS